MDDSLQDELAERVDAPRLFTTSALARTLSVPPRTVRAWKQAGLITPALVKRGVAYFDFSQVAAAKTLCELVQSGVRPERLRQAIHNSEARLSELLHHDGRLLVRLEQGELCETDGQLQLEFAPEVPENTALEPRDRLEVVRPRRRSGGGRRFSSGGAGVPSGGFVRRA